MYSATYNVMIDFIKLNFSKMFRNYQNKLIQS